MAQDLPLDLDVPLCNNLRVVAGPHDLPGAARAEIRPKSRLRTSDPKELTGAVSSTTTPALPTENTGFQQETALWR